MSPIKTSLALAMVLSLFVMSLSGCGDANPQASLNPATGQHVANWLPTGHTVTAKANIESCTDCHGQDLAGGIVKVPCTKCHIGNVNNLPANHPGAWGAFAYALHKDFVNSQKSPDNPNGTSRCANASCHGPTLTGAGNAPSCATFCHMGGVAAKHPTDWTSALASHGSFVNVNNSLAKCSTASCHGTDAKGVFLSGPSCYICHPAGSPAPDSPNPKPIKHPTDSANTPILFFHKNYINSNPSVIDSCLTNICHGSGGTGPSCSTAGCH